MAKPMPAPEPAPEPRPAEYTVVARRYRPQQFAELIGQEHVAQALINALQSGRVAHAYLFTGARGVGKTSAARILAKALNCETGPTATPCDQCDSCLAIAEGQDTDVVEIDGASNNRIDEARDLRQNVGFRPTRGRYKIYIIDEVHMLTTQAFNALLKTLEEPPPHVKFIFATTEVQKIPITILSRCQRFDFAHVGPAKIFDQLKAIVAREKHEADDDALKLVARRAAGSMRDSQSLLDQLLASESGRLTVEHVNAVLGSTGDERVGELAAAILDRDPAKALNLIASWGDRGLQVGELVDQLIECWRTLMLVTCVPDFRDVPVSPNLRELLFRRASTVSLDSVLAGLEVWTTTKARMRGSAHTQVLLEMAVVRLARMDELLSVGHLVQALGQPRAALQIPAASALSSTPSRGVVNVSHPDSGGASKKNGLSEAKATGAAGGATLALSAETVQDVWGRLLRFLGDKSPLLAAQLKFANLPAISGPNSLAIRFHSGYNQAYDACASEQNRSRIEDGLQRIAGHPVSIRVDLVAAPTAANGKPEPVAAPANAARDPKKKLMELPLFRKAGEALGAQIWHADQEFNPVAPPPRTLPAAETPDDDAIPTPEPDPDED